LTLSTHFGSPQLAGKQRIVPGQTRSFELHTGAADTYTGLDAEFAGIEYDLPDFEVRIVTFDEFEEWAAEMGSAEEFHDA